jgi:Protein of unknown function (DUF3999)
VRRWLAIFVLLLTTGIAFAATFEPAKYQYIADINPAATSDTLRRIALPPDLLDLARADLGDLRLVDAATGETVPYLVAVPKTRLANARVAAARLNVAYVKGKWTQATAVFGDTWPKRELFIKTDGTNFKRTVIIQSSPDGKEWSLIQERGHLYRVPEPHAFDKQSVPIPVNDHKFYRIRIYHDRADPAKLTIRSVSAPRIVDDPAYQISKTIQPATRTEDEKKKETLIEFDLDHRHTPWDRLALRIKAPNFWRRYVVEGRKETRTTRTRRRDDGSKETLEFDTPWKKIGGGVLYRFPNKNAPEENTTIDLQRRQARFVRVRIENLDDNPLAIPDAKAVRTPTELRFQSQAGRPLKLYFGRVGDAKPQFDLAHFANLLAGKHRLPESLGTWEKNPAFVAEEAADQAWHERFRVLIWVALLAALGILAALTFRLMRQIETKA